MVEINRACLPTVGRLGEIGHPTRRSILFHKARPPWREFPPYFPSLFHEAKRSLFPLYFYFISILFSLYFYFILFPYYYAFLLQIGFQFRNTDFLEVKNACGQGCICFSNSKHVLEMQHAARTPRCNYWDRQST